MTELKLVSASELVLAPTCLVCSSLRVVSVLASPSTVCFAPGGLKRSCALGAFCGSSCAQANVGRNRLATTANAPTSRQCKLIRTVVDFIPLVSCVRFVLKVFCLMLSPFGLVIDGLTRTVKH